MQDRLQLAEKYVPHYDVRDYHEAHVGAPVADAYAAMRSVDLSRSPIIRAIFALRTLPSRLRGQPSGAPKGPFLEQALEIGWVILEELPGEELIAGAVTQPWEPIVRFRGLARDRFRAFVEPGYAKIAWVIGARPHGGEASTVYTETRVETTDALSRRRFRSYWLLLGTGIRLIRQEALRVVARDLAH